MNPAALLALISDLYEQTAQLRQHNEQLVAELKRRDEEAAKTAGSTSDLSGTNGEG